ncbi:MAG: hypothetical protein IK149_00190 [Oscillospiraceae bacterium]|nr:hypothetical protein [Oscillospiraceae bacterium]
MSSYRDIINGTLQNLADKMKEVSESSGVKDFYSRGAERAKGYARVAKLSLEINGESEELRKVYTEIGKLYFEQNEAAPGPLYEGLFAQAEKLRASLRSKEDEIRARREDFEAAQAEKSGEVEVEIGDFEDIVNATESDGSGQ